MCGDRIVVDTWNCMDVWRQNCRRHLELYGCAQIELSSTLGIVWICGDKVVINTWNCMHVWRQNCCRHLELYGWVEIKSLSTLGIGTDVMHYDIINCTHVTFRFISSTTYMFQNTPLGYSLFSSFQTTVRDVDGMYLTVASRMFVIVYLMYFVDIYRAPRYF